MNQNNTYHRKLKTFPNLKPEDFQHPWDTQAIKALKSIPGFEYLVAKLMEYGFEQFFRIINLSSNVQVKGKMFPSLKETLRYATRILDMPEPELYITTDPMPNAFTYGHTNPFIVLTSGLVECMDDEELFFVIAHELGHIKCGHVLYKTMARHFKVVLDIAASATFGMSGLISTGLQLALFDWSRKSELSADRAGLLCAQNQSVANRSFMRLAAGAKRLYEQMDEGEFLRQIRSFQDASDESFINKTFSALLTARMSHPFIIMRAKMIDEWIKSGKYSDLTKLDMIEVQAD